MQTQIETPDGVFIVTFSEHGLTGLEFPEVERTCAQQRATWNLPPKTGRWHAMTVRAVVDILAGRTPTALPPLDFSIGTDFQKSVWAAISQIGLGKTQTYGQIAASIGKPLAVRAVGGACGANPVPVLVPCHRVLPKSGGMGGFSCGSEWKRRLLAREGILFPALGAALK